jgi:hypothetical protein
MKNIKFIALVETFEFLGVVLGIFAILSVIAHFTNPMVAMFSIILPVVYTLKLHELRLSKHSQEEKN